VVDFVPQSEEQIRATRIGGEKPLAGGRIVLVAYDPGWPRLFEREAARVRAILGTLVCRLEHVGSTAVPGLIAKPIVDMLLVVPDSSDEATYVPPMERAGYRLTIREPDWHQHRLFRVSDANINLHVLSDGSPEIERMLGFRDWLRTHSTDRELYAATKRELAERTWKYTQNYADAKTTVVEQIIARARAASVGVNGWTDEPRPTPGWRAECAVLHGGDAVTGPHRGERGCDPHKRQACNRS
jgi:GrpB-like predicted nucleotidyltransferase (UPF0157 family)